ncbi:MAG TPA: hypothetical protein VK325_04235 [Pseudoxanthomonas sp.]|nr:hypothetical protein [Pseudoxanthomonas sp.]
MPSDLTQIVEAFDALNQADFVALSNAGTTQTAGREDVYGEAADRGLEP